MRGCHVVSPSFGGVSILHAASKAKAKLELVSRAGAVADAAFALSVRPVVSASYTTSGANAVCPFVNALEAARGANSVNPHVVAALTAVSANAVYKNVRIAFGIVVGVFCAANRANAVSSAKGVRTSKSADFANAAFPFVNAGFAAAGAYAVCPSVFNGETGFAALVANAVMVCVGVSAFSFYFGLTDIADSVSVDIYVLAVWTGIR